MDAFDDDEAAVGELVSSLRSQSPEHVSTAAERVARRIAAACFGDDDGEDSQSNAIEEDRVQTRTRIRPDVLSKIVIGMAMVLDRARLEISAVHSKRSENGSSNDSDGSDKNLEPSEGSRICLFNDGAIVSVFECIKNMARDPVLEGDLVRAGALNSVISILISSQSSLSMEASCAGLDALANLTTAAQHSALAHQLGVLPYVCSCLEDGLSQSAMMSPEITGQVVEPDSENEVVQRMIEGAVSVVRNLSAAPHDMRPLVVAQGAITPLVHLVTAYGLETVVCSDAIAALLNVSTHDLSDEALRENGVAPVMLECVGDCVAGVELRQSQVEASRTSDLSSNQSVTTKQDFANFDVEMRSRMKSANLALRTARNMCASELGSHFFSNKAALNILSRAQKVALTLKNKGLDTLLALMLQNTTHVLENVAVFADANVCTDMLSLGTIDGLTKTIGMGSSDAKSSAADALASLILVDERVCEAIKTGVGGGLLYSMIEMRARERRQEEEEDGDSESGDTESESSSYEEEEEEEEEEWQQAQHVSPQREEWTSGAYHEKPKRNPPSSSASSQMPTRPRPAAAFGRSIQQSPSDRL